MKGVVELKRIHNKINDIDFVEMKFFREKYLTLQKEKKQNNILFLQ